MTIMRSLSRALVICMPIEPEMRCACARVCQRKVWIIFARHWFESFEWWTTSNFSTLISKSSSVHMSNDLYQWWMCVALKSTHCHYFTVTWICHLIFKTIISQINLRKCLQINIWKWKKITKLLENIDIASRFQNMAQISYSQQHTPSAPNERAIHTENIARTQRLPSLIHSGRARITFHW